jgi:hypothetical protein
MEIIATFKRVAIWRKYIGVFFYYKNVFYIDCKLMTIADYESHISLGFKQEEIIKGKIDLTFCSSISSLESLNKLLVSDEEREIVLPAFRKYKINLLSI